MTDELVEAIRAAFCALCDAVEAEGAEVERGEFTLDVESADPLAFSLAGTMARDAIEAHARDDEEVA